MQESFWAVSGVYNNIKFVYPFFGRHLAYVAGLGVVIDLVFSGTSATGAASRPDARRGAGAGALLNAVLVLRSGCSRPGPGSSLFPLSYRHRLRSGAG